MADTTLNKTTLTSQTANLYSRMHIYDGLDYKTEPLVTGFSFVQFVVPAYIFPIGNNSNSGEASIGTTSQADAEAVLSANCYAINLPDISISTVEVEGMPGQWINMPGKLEIGSKTTTATYWETYNMDITQVVRQWVYNIREPRNGMSVLKYNTSQSQPTAAGSVATASTAYIGKHYKGFIYWFMTDPTLERILIAAEFLGIWPTRVPYSAINADIRNVDKVELSVEYAFDKFYVYPGTIEYVSSQQTQYWQTRVNHALIYLNEQGEGKSGFTNNNG